MKDFTIESSRDLKDGASSNNWNDMKDDVSHDEGDNEERTSTKCVEWWAYIKPKETYFRCNGIPTRPKIIITLQLGGAQKRKTNQSRQQRWYIKYKKW